MANHFVFKSSLALGAFFLIAVAPCVGRSQTRVDLDDLSVKGELLNDNRMRLSNRESTTIQDRVKYRKDFRSEIIDGSDVRVPAAESLDETIQETGAK